MALFKFYFLSALICGALVLGQPTDSITTPPPSIIDVNPTVPITTTTDPTTTTTTLSTTTITTTTTSSTPPPTTTSTTTTSTTAAPPAPPKPIGPPEQGLWWFPNNKNVTICVIVQFAAQLNVTYPGKDSAELLHAIMNVPANATVVDGDCGEKQQWLTIDWPATKATVPQNNSLTIVFAKNDTTKSYELVNLNATIDSSELPNITNVASVNLYHGKEWQTPVSSSYRCVAPTELKMVSADESSVAATLTVSRLQEEAFRASADKGFSAARDCAGGDIPDAVPIAVGCALGGMVIVVLIAYLVARRRSAARGYLSM